MVTDKVLRRTKIKKRIRAKISGTAGVPRLSVFKSNKAIYAQLIDDIKQHTVASASSYDIAKDKTVNAALAKEVGKKLAEKALEVGIKSVIFDRNGYLYHGRIKALAEGAREGGLQF
jgi:large subunit ribosomal protein L18